MDGYSLVLVHLDFIALTALRDTLAPPRACLPSPSPASQ